MGMQKNDCTELAQDEMKTEMYVSITGL
jgi:hypothetical protein